MDIAQATAALVISCTALFGTAVQMQSWVFVRAQRQPGFHKLLLWPEVWRALKDTSDVKRSTLDDHPDAIESMRLRSESTGWAWLLVAALLSVLASLYWLWMAVFLAVVE
jgi:hypothetical protein